MKITCDSCANCKICRDICCYYGKNEQECSPIFTKENAEKIEKKFGKKIFKPFENSKRIFQLKLIKSKKPSIYICPFFDEETKKCTIYNLRPLDCILFPFTLVRRNGKIYLGIVNEKMCPPMKNVTKEDIENAKKILIKKIKKEKIGDVFRKYPDLILDYENVALLEKIDLDKI